MIYFKRIAFIGLVALSIQAYTSQERKNETKLKEDQSAWVMMDSFHLKLSEVFHPYTDSGNLEPAKRLAEGLAQEADACAAVMLSNHDGHDEIKTRLNQLKSDSRALSKLIQRGASDNEIGTSLGALHDSFHTMMKSWNDSEGVKQKYQH